MEINDLFSNFIEIIFIFFERLSKHVIKSLISYDLISEPFTNLR